MTWIVIRSILWGIAGLVGVPILTAFIVLAMAYTFDSRCGTPGDSGGCEMGSFSAGLAMSLPGFALGFFLSLILGLRKRRLANRSPS
ncbi:MAG TPA: hypothetical protein VMF90_02365 [Rhizobiaceae bacterium]|nr:hypothetical protein [Rhizobiaceae bacterium]